MLFLHKVFKKIKNSKHIISCRQHFLSDKLHYKKENDKYLLSKYAKRY